MDVDWIRHLNHWWVAEILDGTCSVTNWMPKLILFDHISPTCCLTTGFRSTLPLSCSKLTGNGFVKICVETTPGACPELQVHLCLLELHFLVLVPWFRRWNLQDLNSVLRWTVPWSTAGSALNVGESRLGKPWFCCFIRTRSFSGLLFNLYPKLSQFQPINLLISFPSPCGTPGKGKCRMFDVVWICVLHRWRRHLEIFFSANTQEQLRL